MNKVALVIPVYNRPEYVKQCFESLTALTVKPDMVVIVDDGSTEIMPEHPWRSLVKEQGYIWRMLGTNHGVKHALMIGIEDAITAGADLIITLDSDTLVKPDFIERLVRLHDRQKMIVSGFNNPKEKIIKLLDSCAVKAHANGINMCFNREQYEKHIKPALQAKSGNWDYMASESAGSVAITIPSCVQHIGLKSSMGHIGADVAHDFKRLSLPNVTLFGIDGHDVAGINRAAEISQRDIQFGAVNIITKDLFRKGTNEQRREDYSRFMLKELYKHFSTSHVLTIHADGYVLNCEAWNPEWLQYDYIGATWWYKDGRNVGNGGFSLRSKKLCDLLAEHHLDYLHPEDYHICRTYRPALEQLGIKFAPAEVADRFSIEAYGVPSPDNRYSGSFGFHGPHVDMSMLPKDLQYRKK